LNSVYNRKFDVTIGLLVEAGILRYLPLKTWIMNGGVYPELANGKAAGAKKK
jgi:hypothetical protein